MFIPTYKWGQTETHVVITVDAASIESHNVYPDGRCEINGSVPGKVCVTLIKKASLICLQRILTDPSSRRFCARRMYTHLPTNLPALFAGRLVTAGRLFSET